MKRLSNEQIFVRNGSFNFDYHKYYYPDDKDLILDEIQFTPSLYYKQEKGIGNVKLKNVCASFDIETSSFYYNNEKCACMYIWMFAVNGKCIIGRTWEQFIELITDIHRIIDIQHRLVVYVHNLGFDFSFICRHIKWYKTFCVSTRSPIYGITEGGIEFRDSYILTAKNLAKSAEDLLKYKIDKLVGDLDYNLLRGSNTTLSDQELDYCTHDVLVLNAIIQEKMERDGNITRLPLTNTGYVRNYYRGKCLGTGKYRKREHKFYRDMMQILTMTYEDYVMLRRAFMGGFTHANVLYVGQTITLPVDSFDFTSSYPAVLLSEMFPMSRGVTYDNLSQEEFFELKKTHLLVLDITFYNIREKDDVFENYLSSSKCKCEFDKSSDDKTKKKKKKNRSYTENNGRIVRAKKLFTTITNVDFDIINNFYDFDSIQVGRVIAYQKGYLPKPILQGVLELYGNKTSLKDVEGQEVSYMVSKGMLNATYGCMVTDPVKDMIEFNNTAGWVVTKADEESAIDKYNTSKNRFLYYPWGIFCTAYARRNLFMGIQEFGQDYIYSDTDSIKCINADKHKGFINWYNESIKNKIDYVLRSNGIDPELSRPSTIDGVQKQIGVWDHETRKGAYTRFKTLGAKRYMYTDSKGLHITVAGLSKKQGAKYLSTFDDPYEYFDDYMTIPEENTGKLCHTYIDSEQQGVFTDYQ